MSTHPSSNATPEGGPATSPTGQTPPRPSPQTPRDLTVTNRSTLRRVRSRGSRDRTIVHEILDQGLVAHVGFVHDGSPFVLPMAHGRRGEELILHGAVASRLMTSLASGIDVCVTVTLLDGLVLARSTFHHAMNYRSVVLFGRATPITDAQRKAEALDALVEHLVPGRSREARRADAQEIAATSVLTLPIDEGSAKVRTGPPKDAERDLELPVWAGVVPLRALFGSPEPSPDLAPGIEASASVRELARRLGPCHR